MQNIFFLIKNYSAKILFLICILGVFGMAFYFMQEDNSNTKDLAYINDNKLDSKKEEEKTDVLSKKVEKYYVDLKGAVKNPGVYQVDSGAIIQDVINLAGGFRNDAYQNNINLSKKVSNEMVIYIYTKLEIATYQKQNNENNINVTSSFKECTTSSYIISECVEEKAPIIEVGIDANYKDNNTTSKPIDTPSDSNNSSSGNLKDDSSNNKLVNINLATEEELSTLNGIGSSKAKKIIEYRTENGKFNNITDIMNVSGIGETIFAKIKSFITV